MTANTKRNWWVEYKGKRLECPFEIDLGYTIGRVDGIYIDQKGELVYEIWNDKMKRNMTYDAMDLYSSEPTSPTVHCEPCAKCEESKVAVAQIITGMATGGER